MNNKWCKLLWLFSMIYLWFIGVPALGQTPSPKALGYHQVAANESMALALLLERIRDGIETNDPYLYLNALAEDYHEAPLAQAADAEVLQKNGDHALARARELNGRAAFLQAALRRESAGRARHKTHLETSSVSYEKDLAFCTLRVRDAGGVLARSELRFQHRDGHWQLVQAEGLSYLPAFFAPSAAEQLTKTIAEGFSVLAGVSAPSSKTFLAQPISREYQINTLSRSITAEKLQRRLFSMSHGSALFAQVQERTQSPYVIANYVQFITDPAWNRIVYGDYQRWIKAYDAKETGVALQRPTGIVTDQRGFVYVADTGNRRVLILQLAGAAHDLSLVYRGVIGQDELLQPVELAWDDRGTIFDKSDDLLWVGDAGNATLSAYRIGDELNSRLVHYHHEDWRNLSGLALGRFEGRSDGHIYLADAGTRRIYRLYFDGETIVVLNIYQGKAEMTPGALASDHWGNVYLTDTAMRKIQKFSPALNSLAVLATDDTNFQPLRFNPLFGSVILADGRQLWSGYDQAFLLENWTEQSGGRRYELSIEFQLKQARLSPELSELQLDGVLTDNGHLTIEVVSAKSNASMAALAASWQNAGELSMIWDRRRSNGEMIAPGHYKLRQTLQSTYNKPPSVEESSIFYLPLYYYEDCGAHVTRDAHLSRGQRLAENDMPDQTVVTDAQEVIYRFDDLRPGVSYEARARYVSYFGVVEQAFYADENELLAPVNVGRESFTSGWLMIPSEAVRDGRVQLRIVKTGGAGQASVAELWLREASYDGTSTPIFENELTQIPQTFTLEQNYPNPFNPQTTITFDLPQDYQGHVSLRIYDMMGKLVRELINEDRGPGRYRVVWDGLDQSGRRLASGLYLYQLRAGGFSTARKLILMK